MLHDIPIDKLLGDGVEKAGIAFSKIDHPLINDYKFLWRDKGDFLSRQYTGTISTISKVSEDGKEGFWGKLNHKITSAQRLLVNSVGDNSNQEVIDIILGNHGKLQQRYDYNHKLQTYINMELFSQESLYTSLDFLKVNVSSWNLGGAKPLEETINIYKWLFPFDQNWIPDMFIIGFQEIVPLTATNVI